MRDIKSSLNILFFCAFVVTFFFYKFVCDDKKVFNIFLNKTEPKTCGRYPETKDIFTDNSIWQVLQHPKGFVKILNAYIDTRPDKGVNSTVVRLNVNSVKLKENEDMLYCQFWFEGKAEALVVKATEILLMWSNLNRTKMFVKITRHFSF